MTTTMTIFWTAAVGLMLLAILMLMSGARRGPSDPQRGTAAASNTVVRRQQLATLNSELAAGIIMPAEHRAAITDLERSALEEADAGHSSGAGAPSPFAAVGRTTSVGLGLVVAAFAIGVYGFIGNLDALDPPAVVAEAAPPATADDSSAQGVSDMLDAMSTRMAAQREGTVDAAGWALVARSYASLQRFDKANDAFARARALAPNDAQLLADHADVLAMLQGGRLTDEPARLVARALQIDPANAKALALSAVPTGSSAAVGTGGTGSAGGTGGTGVTSATATAAIGSAAASASASALKISGKIRLSNEMVKRIEPTDEVFVFARAPGGSGMPIAVARYRATSFPLDFTLDASNIVGAPTRLAGLSQVVLGVRVSRSGDATPQSGDPRAESAPVGLRATGQELLIEGTTP